MKKVFSFFILMLMIIVIGCDESNNDLLGTHSENNQLPAPVLVSIDISSYTNTLPIGENMQFTAIGNYDDNSSEDITNEVLWSSENSNTASIDLTGLATGVSEGTVDIKAELDTIQSTIQLTISDTILFSIRVIPLVTDIIHVDSLQYTAIGEYLDGTEIDITNEVSWTSSDPSVVTIDEFGFAESIQTGYVDIIATKGFISSTAGLTVLSP